MDPLTTSIVVILGKYALDKGGELVQEVGPQALEVAKDMFAAALNRLRKTPGGEHVASEFEEDPSTYEKPMQKELDKAVQADPDFGKELAALLEKYHEAAQTHAAATGKTYHATLTGSGAQAIDHSTAAGEGGIAIGGRAKADIELDKKKKKDKKGKKGKKK